MPDFVDPQLTEKSLQETRRAVGRGDLYVFGYGSLMWHPGFRFIERSVARIYGYHRRLAVRSWHYRGTPQKPGLVFGLDKGGSCYGTLYCVAKKDKERILRYLFRREMFANVYRPRFVAASPEDGKGAQRALVFVVRRDTPNYAPPMPDEKARRIIRRAAGMSGANVDYIKSTQQRLTAMGVACPQLTRLCRGL